MNNFVASSNFNIARYGNKYHQVEVVLRGPGGFVFVAGFYIGGNHE